METSPKNHWNRIYSSKGPEEVSWTQDIPQLSLDFIHAAHLDRYANIIDVGGGESRLVDFLLEEGFQNITVLDISTEAIDRVRKRLGERAVHVTWIVSDVTEFEPNETYDFWHDRATFHFLTTTPQITQYLTTVHKALKKDGVVTIGTFSENGPGSCSGLPVRQYSEVELQTTLQQGFEKLKCIHEEHITPFQTTQSFLFCSFRHTWPDDGINQPGI